MKDKTFGLIGRHLTHSFSPSYFKKKFLELDLTNYSYKAFSLDHISLICELIDNNQLSGLNVTIPYKETIIPYLDQLSEVSEEIQAVNTIIFKDGKLIGDNTDVHGFRKSLELFLPDNWKGSALILGSGGASKAVQYVMKQKGISFQIVSRKKAVGYINYKQVTKSILETHKLIINTTPLGMYPEIDTLPELQYQYLDEDSFLYDLVYNPSQTAFLKKGIGYKANTKSAYDMLIFQAEKSWELWHSFD